jgi:xanthine dehydrogenase/oxidase
MIKHDHHEFPSDIFLILETVGAELTIGRTTIYLVPKQEQYKSFLVNFDGDETKLSPLKFITYDMSQSVLKTITLTPYPDSCKYVSYKVCTTVPSPFYVMATIIDYAESPKHPRSRKFWIFL